MSTTQSKELKEFAEELYLSVVEHNQQLEENIKLLSASDDQIVPGFPAFNVGNLRSTLLGGEPTQRSTFQELLDTRTFYEGRNALTTKLLGQNNNEDQLMYMQDLKEHLCASTSTLVIKVFHKEVQKLFLNKGNKLKQPSIVLYLYGLSQKDLAQRLEITSLQLSISTRLDVIKECVKIHHEHTHNSRFINNTMAKKAYARIVQDPHGTHRPTINLNNFARDFPKALSHAIHVHGMIDQWQESSIFKSCRETNFRESPICSHKDIEYYPDKGKEETKNIFWVVVIDQAFTQTFWEEFTSAIDNLKFLAGIRGKNDVFVRCSNNEQAIFAVGKTRTAIYPSHPMNAFEEKITKLARFVMKFQRCYVQRLVGNDFLVTWDVNMLHYIVGPIKNAVYAAHNDSSPLLCSPSNTTRPHVSEVAHLPQMEEMQVLTMYWTNIGDDFDHQHHDIAMNYYYNRQKIAYIPLTGRGIHIQGPGSQSSGITHEIKAKGLFDSNIYRGICTTRLSLTPRHGKIFDEAKSKFCVGNQLVKEVEYAHTEVQQRCVTHFQTGNAHETESKMVVQQLICNRQKRKAAYCSSVDTKKSPTRKQNANIQPTAICTQLNQLYPSIDKHFVALLSQKYPSSYKTLPTRLATTLQESLPTFDHSISIGPISDQLTKGDSIEQMFSAGYLLNLKQDAEHVIPCLYHFHQQQEVCCIEQFPIPGKHYKLSLISADAGVDHNSRSHQPLNPKIGTNRIILLTKIYKQNPKLMENFIKWLDVNFSSTKPASLESDLDEGKINPILHVYGSGGARTFSGEKPPTASSSKHDPLVYVGSGQDINNPVNSKLLNLASRLQVVAIFLNEAMYYGDETNSHDPTMCRFLGYFQICNAMIHSGDCEEDVMGQFPTLKEQEKRFLSFRLQPHLRVEAHPLIATMKQIHSLNSSGDSKHAFKQLCIDHESRDTIPYIDLSERTQKQHITSKTLSFQTRDAIKQFIIYGHIERYIMDYRTGEKVSENIGNDLEDIKPTTNRQIFISYLEKYIHQSMGTSAKLSDLVHACLYASVASALRFSRLGMLVSEKGIYATAIQMKCLGVTLQCRPINNPNRCLDIVCMFMREVTCDVLSIDKSQQHPLMKIVVAHEKLFLDCLFRVILLRVTGNTQKFRSFKFFIEKKHDRMNDHQYNLIPGPDEFAAFAHFIESCCTTMGTSGIQRWVTKQHEGAIPNQIKTNVHVFLSFGQNLISLLPKFTKELFHGKNCCVHNRISFLSEMDKLMTDSFINAGTQPTGKNKWLSHIILADMEEIFDSPFGPVSASSVPSGENSRMGFHVLKKTRGSKYTWNRCLQEIKSHVPAILNNEMCMLLGFEKKENILVNSVNGRMFTETDAEHFLCKFWTMIKYTFSHYRYSSNPIMANSHTHPNPSYTPESDLHGASILKSISIAFTEMTKSETILPPLPDVCKIPGE